MHSLYVFWLSTARSGECIVFVRMFELENILWLNGDPAALPARKTETIVIGSWGRIWEGQNHRLFSDLPRKPFHPRLAYHFSGEPLLRGAFPFIWGDLAVDFVSPSHSVLFRHGNELFWESRLLPRRDVTDHFGSRASKLAYEDDFRMDMLRRIAPAPWIAAVHVTILFAVLNVLPWWHGADLSSREPV